MKEQIPLFYLQWDEVKGEITGQVNEVSVGTEELFLRKLVNATVINNYIWEHTSHETNEFNEGIIYVKPWLPINVKHGKEIKDIVFSQFEGPGQDGVEFFLFDNRHYSKICSQRSDQSLHTAQFLLDHYRYIEGKYFALTYAILDPSRCKTLIFLETGE